ncbi:hypothetical protein FBALC1_12497 [Flavobacteriales bacterium ALC-1]|nr:hypothetical protein FBALC1_12497 [Flavobacteriales bacterium ALC-1]
MTEQLISYLKYGNHFYGVELTQLKGEYKYYGIALKKKRAQLDIKASFEATAVEKLKDHIPKGKPLVLVINTDSVLTKKVKAKTKETLKLVHMAFPNIKTEDFYYETISQGEHHFVSICRKTYVDDLLNDYTTKNINVIDFTLGNLISTTLIPFISSNYINTSNASISLEDALITNIFTQEVDLESSHDINGLDIKNNLLLSFAAALNLVVKTNVIQSSFSNTKEELNTTFKQKLFASQFLKMGLSTLFVILLINFLFFNHYYNEVNTLKETAQILEASKVKMVSLNEKVQKTEKMVDDVLKSSDSKSSLYVDVIINNLPKSILLKELNYQPLLKKIKEDKAIENFKNQILISGQSNNSIEFSQWVSQLENFKWIQSVNILSFEDTSKSSSSFTIKLNMQDDTED